MIDLGNNNVEGRYASWLKQGIDFISPKNLHLVSGRGTAKSTDILADRSIDICYDMPRAMFALVSDTYVNALTNIVPKIIEGWRERKGWIEGVHYVTDERPPDHFNIPYSPILNYKHTISIHNGCFFNIGSMDQVSSLAGNSYQHIFGDEAKYLNPNKLKKLMPARRGFPEVAHSIYYRGLTFTTDMPNVTEGDFDWILDNEKNMDIEKIKLALRAGSVLNEIRHEFYEACRKKAPQHKIDLIQKNYTRWYMKWMQTRVDSTLFYIASSFVNADILQAGYYKDVLESDGIEEFKASILSLRPNVKKGEKFYGNLGDHHFYSDGVNNQYYIDNYGLNDAITPTSYALNRCNAKFPLDCGIDFGDMTSMVIGQDARRYYNVLKNFYTLAPQSSKELAKQFLDFFEPHRRKVLNMYYDRAGNQYKKIKRDWATEIKDHIENYEGKSTGWKVNLMSEGQGDIYHEQEFNFMKKFMGDYYEGLPQLRIDELQCRELKSSLSLAKIKMSKDRNGSMRLQKDKSSEKLPLRKLPMYSTNFSDAFKYLMYRPKWVKLSERRLPQQWSEPVIVG